jgi:hypothetical protein
MAEIGTTPNRVYFASAGAVRRRFPSAANELAPLPALPRSQVSDLERAHFRCLAELMVLKPRRIIGNADRFDVLNRAEYLEDFLGAVTAFTKVVVADIAREFPIGFIEDETDRLAEAAGDVAGALKNAVDRMIDAEVA